MELPTISFFFLALLLLLLLPQSSTSLPADTPHDSVVECLAGRSVPRDLLFSPKSTNFTAAFSSPLQNQRAFLNDRSPKPFLIVTPTDESHARAAVLCSRGLNLHLRTRSGGHDYEGLSYTSTLGPFLLLDLLHLRSISFDKNTAWVQSGATLGELYSAIAAKSPTLAFPAGFCPTVGVGGHISGGGIGTIMRAHGIAADHVIDARILNSDGAILQRESMKEHLFWAVRGGGAASFGVILAYKIRLVQIPPKITVFSKTLTLEEGANRALQQWQDEAYRVDNRLYISATLSAGNNTGEAVFSSLFLGELKELLPIIKKSFFELKLKPNDCKEMSWIESLVVFSAFPKPDINGGPLSILLNRNPIPHPFSFKVKSDIITTPIKVQNWEKIWKYIMEEDAQPMLLIEPLGGKVAEIAETETPFPHRNGSKFVIQHIINWEGTGEKDLRTNLDSLSKFYEFMAPFVSKNPRAAYLNFRDLDLGRNVGGEGSYKKAETWGLKYYKVNFERLALVKAQIDPNNFFKNEQSIPPLF